MQSSQSSPSPTKANRKHIWRYVRLAIGLALIIWLIPTFVKADFWKALAGVNVTLVLLALLLAFASTVVKSWRWGVIMHWRGMQFSQFYFMVMYLIGIFFNNFLPSGLGGDVVRAYETARDSGRSAESFTTVLIERGGGMIVVFGIGGLFALVTPLSPDFTPWKLLSIGLFLGGLIGLWALWLDLTGRILAALGARLPRRLSGIWLKVMRIYEEFRLYRHEWRLFGSIIALSIVSTVLGLVSVYMLLLAYGQAVSFGGFAAFFSIESAIEVLPISLNSLGVREGAYVFFLKPLGVDAPIALGVSLLVRLIILLHAVVGGIAYVLRNVRQRPAVAHTTPGTAEELPRP